MRCLVVGMGLSGLSMARHWARLGHTVSAVDDRSQPPKQAAFMEELPTVKKQVGAQFRQWQAPHYDDYDIIGISPGIDPTEVAAAENKQTVDAAIFTEMWQQQQPMTLLLAVTGTNGKSTTVILAEHLLRTGGISAEAVGNVGVPLLDAWNKWQESGFPETAIVELSSFQLALAPKFVSDVAVVLNVSEDHLDRHGTMDNYAAIKRRIYQHAARVVVNIDDNHLADVLQEIPNASPRTTFSAQHAANWRLTDTEIVSGVVRYPLAKMSGACRAQPIAVMAALALLADTALTQDDIAAGLVSFGGLAHRQQFVANINGVRYVNDSKATNVSATLFGLSAVGGEVVLIIGGEGKEQDFTPLKQAKQWVRHVVVIGRAADALQAAFAAAGVSCERAESLPAAVQQAAAAATANQTVMLSPACSSLDMFDNYAERGAVFSNAVAALQQEAV